MAKHEQNWTVLLLSLMMFMAPAMGVPSEELLQDTFKSVLVSFFSLTALFVFFWYQRNQTVVMHFHSVQYLPLGLMLYAFGSMAWSHAYLGGVEAIRWFVFSVILLLGINTLTMVRVPRLLWGVHLGAVIASLWVALQFWVDFRLFPQGPNPASTFINRNFFAEFVVCTLPFSVLLLSRVGKRDTVFLLTFSLGFNIAALLMTGTRSALIGLLALVLLLPCIIWLCRKQSAAAGMSNRQWVTAAALLIFTVLCLGSINTANPKLVAESGRVDAIDRAVNRTLSMTRSAEYINGSFSIRALMWKATGRMIQVNPLTGVGAGAWEVQIPLYQESGSQLETDYYAHNEMLQLVAEYGLAGWLFLLSLVSYLLWAAFITLSDQTDKGKKEAPLRASTLASLFVFLIVSNAGFAWRMATTGALFALSLSILAASDVRLGVGRPMVIHAMEWRSRFSQIALGVTTLCLAIALYISQQAIECESKLVRAIKMALTISQSSNRNSQQWQSTKAEMLRLMREGIAINPHYRKLTPMAADAMAGWGDWKNAIWIWESVVASRPYVVAILANIARGHLLTGNFEMAQEYINRAKNVQPTAPALSSLQVQLWSRTGKEPDAIFRAKELIQGGTFDYDLIQVAYELGTRNRDLPFAIQALELQIKTWPSRAVDGWLKLGGIYDLAEAKDEIKALRAFQACIEATPPQYKKAILEKIPPNYRALIKY
jgi:O-antigen ligase